MPEDVFGHAGDVIIAVAVGRYAGLVAPEIVLDHEAHCIARCFLVVPGVQLQFLGLERGEGPRPKGRGNSPFRNSRHASVLGELVQHSERQAVGRIGALGG